MHIYAFYILKIFNWMAYMYNFRIIECSNLLDLPKRFPYQMLFVSFNSCLSLCPFYFCHCIVCPSIYGFWLLLWPLQSFLRYLPARQTEGRMSVLLPPLYVVRMSLKFDFTTYLHVSNAERSTFVPIVACIRHVPSWLSFDMFHRGLHSTCSIVACIRHIPS